MFERHFPAYNKQHSVSSSLHIINRIKIDNKILPKEKEKYEAEPDQDGVMKNTRNIVHLTEMKFNIVEKILQWIPF